MIVIFLTVCNVSAEKRKWEKVDEGLYIGRFDLPKKSTLNNNFRIIIIKIDPAFYSFKLLSAKEHGLPGMTAKEWCKNFGLISCINAGMFQTDYLSNVGYMKNFEHINNKRVVTKHLSVFAANPVGPDKPQARIFDIDEKNIKDIIKDYNVVIQNLRLIKRPRQNRWAQQDKMWSEAALAEDEQGNILFVFSRAPYSMHDFNDILLQLPINIVCAQHLEGGPEASLYFSYKNIQIDEFGSYETDYKENDGSDYALRVPNVLGILKK
jgi:hypothetical protein